MKRRTLLTSLAGAAAVGSMPSPLLSARSKRLPDATPRYAPPPPHRAQDGELQVPGAKLWYWDTGGAGHPVVLLHPATGSAAVWPYQQTALAAAGFRVIAYSRRGHFRSEAGPLDTPAAAIDDLETLLTTLKLSGVHLVGLAAGGFMVPDAALSFPHLLRSITISGSLGGVVDPDYSRTTRSLLPAGFDKLPHSFRELGPAYRASCPEGVAEWERLEHDARHTAITQRPRNVLSWDAVGRINLPTLLMTGDADLYMPPPRPAKWTQALPHAQAAVIAGAGHAPQWEQPERFNDLLITFLRANASRSRRAS